MGVNTCEGPELFEAPIMVYICNRILGIFWCSYSVYMGMVDL